MPTTITLTKLPVAAAALLLPLFSAASPTNSPRHYSRQDGTTLIPSTSFSTYSDYWTDLYPWGTDHNGGARMDSSQISTSDGTLTLTADPVTGEPPAENGGVEYPVNYLSGAIHATQTFSVSAGGGLDFSGEFLATTTYGTWPAFWLTATEGWPPEIDMAEWKGSGDISFNTFNTSSEVGTHDVPYPNPEEWHEIRCELRDDGNGRTVRVKYFLDGVEQTTHYGEDYVGAGFYLIINLQMEGSSGSPGPDYAVEYSARNVQVISYNP